MLTYKDIIFLIILTVIFEFNLFSQVIDSPELIRVSVDPETGDVGIFWNFSTSVINYYGIEKAHPAGQGGIVEGITVGTTPSFNNSYIYTSSDSDLESEGYRVYAAINDEERSENTEWHNTIFLTSELDSCNGRIILRWNEYTAWTGNILKYNVYRKVNGSDYSLDTTITEGTNEIIIGNIFNELDYSFYVAAYKNNVDNDSSLSNRVDITPTISRVPEYINADYATNNNNLVEISFTVDENTEISTYKLIRYSITGSYDTVMISNTNRTIRYFDALNYLDGPFFYRLIAVNSCGDNSTVSNIASTIVIHGEIDNYSVSVNWNAYLNWHGGVSEYIVYRRFGTSNYEPVTSMQSNSFSENLENYTNRDLPGNVCYYIEAVETESNPYSIQGTSTSNEICLTIPSKIKMPNAFTPDGDMINDDFGPVLDFIPEKYLLMIYNRWGTLVFKSDDPYNRKWDGKLKSGEQADEGVYVYYLEIENEGQEVIKQNGSLTLIIP